MALRSVRDRDDAECAGMTEHTVDDGRRYELDRDRAFERSLFWKGLLALLVVVVVAVIRQRYFV